MQEFKAPKEKKGKGKWLPLRNREKEPVHTVWILKYKGKKVWWRTLFLYKILGNNGWKTRDCETLVYKLFLFFNFKSKLFKEKKKKTNTDSLTQKENEETAKDIGKEAEGTKKDGQKS